MKINSSSILVILIATVLLVSSPAIAKKYYIDRVNIEAQLQKDGSMEIREFRTYRFRSGTFRFAFQEIPINQGVDYLNFQVFEDGKPYRESDSEDRGTFKVTRKRNSVEVRWFYRARKETRTFEVRYTATNAVKTYNDAAVLYQKFIGNAWKKMQKNVTVTVLPPENISSSQMNAWLHGPLWGSYDLLSGGGIEARIADLPRYTHFEIRALYPTELFPTARRIDDNVRAEIMAEEAAAAEAANREREQFFADEAAREKRWAWGKWVMAMLAMVGISGYYVIYQMFGRRPPVTFQSEFQSEIPEKTPPALVQYLTGHKQVGGGALVATLFDLANRGFLSMEEFEKEKKKFFGGSEIVSAYAWKLDREKWRHESQTLLGFERSVVEFLFNELSGAATDRIELDYLKKKQSKMTKFFHAWQKEVKEEGERRGWYDQTSKTGMYYALGFGIVLGALALASIVPFGPWAWLPGATAIVVTMLAFAVQHRTEVGETLARKWKAVSKYLRKGHFHSNSAGMLDNAANYFVYGPVLGVSDKTYKELAGFIPHDKQAYYVPWYHSTAHGHGFAGVSGFGDAVSSMISSTSTAMSTASGSGGGASGGGGGGAGGGGGGAG